jgi:hypothetical protein
MTFLEIFTSLVIVILYHQYIAYVEHNKKSFQIVFFFKKL